MRYMHTRSLLDKLGQSNLISINTILIYHTHSIHHSFMLITFIGIVYHWIFRFAHLMPNVKWSSDPFVLNHSLQSPSKVLLHIWEPCPDSNSPQNKEHCSCCMHSFQHTVSYTCIWHISRDSLAGQSWLCKLASVYHHYAFSHMR